MKPQDLDKFKEKLKKKEKREKKKKKEEKKKRKGDDWEYDESSDYPIHEKYTKEEPVKE